MSGTLLFRDLHGVLRAVALGACLGLAALRAEARTLVLPHILEKTGRITDTQFTFDTSLFLTYTPTLPAPAREATVDLYVYDSSTGKPFASQGKEVCAPCSFDLTDADRTAQVDLEDVMFPGGDSSGSSVKTGFGILVVGGSDPDGVAIQGFVVNSHTSAFDTSVFGFEPQPLADSAAPDPRRVFVLPHVLEASGRSSSTQFTFDTQLFVTYAGGLPGSIESSAPGSPGAQGASVDIYLRDDATGGPMVSPEGIEVCNPCQLSLDSAQRKLSFSIEQAFANAGARMPQALTGHALVDVSGDPGNVSLTGFVVNSHTGPFDVSACAIKPQRVSGSDHSEDPGAPPSPRRVFVLPHVLEASGRITDSQYTLDTEIHAVYSSGILKGTNGAGAALDLYLIDNRTGEALRSASGEEVCAPCAYGFGPGLIRKQAINIDALISARGGFASNVPDSRAVCVVSGPDPEGLSLQGFVVNSHTSPQDLSIATVEPQLLSRDEGQDPPQTRRVFVLPHVLEASGRITNTQFTFDTTLFMTYTASAAGARCATANLYLLDSATGAPLQSKSSSDVCAPCSFELGAGGSSSRTLSLEDEVVGRGGLATDLAAAFVVLEVTGDADGVAAQGYVVNSHTGPFDLSVFGFDPVPISAARIATRPVFLRGDANGDGALDLSDAIASLSYLFTGGDEPGCLKAADTNGKDGVDISDPIHLLGFLFLGGAGPATPFPGCGIEEEETVISCASYSRC